ncbi:DNA polymerase III subunit delta [Syntrophomonas wolfei]|jgi:DNA polymerase-3 subunit delta|nr:DNA polymerase III subunit delta [Syntrophomonas wolfei]
MSKNRIYFLWGEEGYLIDRELERIAALMSRESGEEVETAFLDADELNAYELLEALEFSPLFSSQRLVIIKRPWWLGKAKRRGGKTAEIEKIFLDYLQHDMEGQVLVLTANEHSATNPLVKILDREATVIACKSPGPQQLSEWINKEFASYGLKVEKSAANLMAKSGQDMYYLQNLIDKTALLVKGRPVKIADIEGELETKAEIKVFKLSDALLKRNLKASFQAYNQLLVQGEHPILFLYIIVRQFMALARVKYYSEESYGSREIVAQTGLHEFMVKKMLDNARNFSWDELRQLFQIFLQTDVKFKSSSLDDKMLMEALIVEICSKR